MSLALLLIDIQNDYFPGGKMELEGSHAAAQAAARLLAYFRELKLPLFHIQHISLRPGATFFLPNTPGVEIYSGVQPLDGETVIQKHFPNSFRETELLAQLQSKGITKLVIAGMMTHMCVEATTRAAADLGFECMLAADACATRSLKFGERVVSAADVQAAFLAGLNGSYARVIPVDEVITALDAR
jgi:nicotinamidase-related amidase